MNFMNFKLIDRMTMRNAKLTVSKKLAKRCFLYEFEEGGFSVRKYEQWMEGKIIDIYEFTGRFGCIRKCPWCHETITDLSRIYTYHNKQWEDIETIKLSNQLYVLLLTYLREGSYDAFAFLVNRSCQFCENPVVRGRDGKCAIPESSRNKPRSIKILGLEFDNFNIAKYGSNAVAIIYSRKPIKEED